MRKLAHIIAALAVLLVWASCERNMDGGNAVRLHASMVKVPTRGTPSDDSGIRDYDYPDPLTIALIRVDENATNSSYPFFKSTGQPVRATMDKPDSYQRRNIAFNDAQYFRNDNDHIRFASWYPANGVYNTTADLSTVRFGINGATDIMYGSITDGNKEEGFADIIFNHALCQFNIYAYKMNAGTDEDRGDIDWGALTDIAVRNVQKSLILSLPHSQLDEYTVTIPEEAEDLQTINLSAADNGIFWNPGTEIPFGFDSKKKVAAYIAAPPVGGFITLGISTTTRNPYQQVSIARNFQPGCAYDIVLRFSSHGIINAEVSVGNWTYGKPDGDGNKIVHDVNADMYYDLSAYSTANSYIIPSGGYGYSFVGNVKGNGSQGIDPGYIDILWSDNTNIWTPGKNPDLAYKNGGNYVQMATHHLSKNRVMVKVGDIEGDSKSLEHKGNVVIAAYDRMGGNILWTWHLWLNDTLGSIGLYNGYLIQSQNLGATPGNPNGLYYQWGRKDPFTTSNSADGHTVSISTTVEHPTTFYGTGNTWFNGSEDEMKHLWGWESDSKDIAKSMYDPCPPGYQVPDYRMMHGARSISKDDVNKTVTVTIGQKVVTFPYSGYLNESGVLQSNTEKPFLLWSSSYDKNGTDPYSFQYPASGSSPVKTEEKRVLGGAVRCVAKSQTVVKNLSDAQTANTYIISSDGYYKFKVDVAGNGVGSLITDRGTEWDMRGKLWGRGDYIDHGTWEVDKVEYLWYQPALNSGIPSTITSDNVCVKILNDGIPDSNGYILIEVEGWSEGNVVLAAYDKSGTILWSWQLWLTEKPKDLGNGRYTVMDRNLGATFGGVPDSAEKAMASYGLYYQWGRKDPFPGPPQATGASATSSSSAWFKYDKSHGSWARQDAIQVIDGPLSITEAAKKPDFFIRPTVQNEKYGSSDPQRWHWMEGYLENNSFLFCKALWGYAIEDGGIGIYPSKTMYDPCPPGYTVAHHWVYWNTDTSNAGEKTSRSDFIKSGSYGYSCDKLNSALFLPLAGRRDRNGNNENAGTTGYLWGSTPKSGGRTMVYGSIFRGIGNKSGVNNDFDWGYDQAYGQSVRCLKQ